MTNKLIRANIQRYITQSFDEYGDPNPVYILSVNGKKLTLKTRGKKLPSAIDFSQKFEFIFEVSEKNEIVALSCPSQNLTWGNQSQIKTLAGSKKPKKTYQLISGIVTDKSSKTETVNTHLPRFGMQGKTFEKNTIYTINISGRTVGGSSSYRKIKVGDSVSGVTNQHGYLEMLKNIQTGKKYGLNTIWPMIIALLITVLMNVYFFYDGSMNTTVKYAFGEFPEYYEKCFFFNLLAIPLTVMSIFGTIHRFRILSFHKQNSK